MYSGEACLICARGHAPDTVAALEATYLNSSADGPVWGYCWLATKRHVVEPYELSTEEASAFMRDIQRAGRAIQQVTGAVKINYEIHGNAVPHLHVHLFPRYKGDAFEGGPINPKIIKASPYRAEGSPSSCGG
ncbi:MAG TPA: HIT family protein [Blastocatellia bacterium]|nr:HIT family protein [Blastocatellia bacterium]